MDAYDIAALEKKKLLEWLTENHTAIIWHKNEELPENLTFKYNTVNAERYDDDTQAEQAISDMFEMFKKQHLRNIAHYPTPATLHIVEPWLFHYIQTMPRLATFTIRYAITENTPA